MAPTSYGKFLIPFGAGFGISISQTRPSHRKARAFAREHVTFVDETTFIASSLLKYFSRRNMDNEECHVIIWNFSGFVQAFLYIKGVF
jgi:hypothetical protein